MNDDGSKRIVLLLLVLAIAGPANSAFAQGTAFTYQGRLQDSGANANGNYDFQFTLWDVASGGTPQPQPSPVTVTRPSVAVANGVFTVQLDFGATAFPGADRFLETSVRPAGGGAFTVLAPRQQVTSTPYAVRSASAASADSVPVSAIPSGSSNYIQNSTTSQAGGNFNISGNGTVGGTLSGNSVDSTTQYKILGTPVLSYGNDSFFAGPGAGAANTTGNQNSFFGNDAGRFNSTGYGNAFFGFTAGSQNVAGFDNSFFGNEAGSLNTIGSNNSFFGSDAGFSNTSGNSNSFFGTSTGFYNTTGGSNSFFGTSAGAFNTTGGSNSFFGVNAGLQNTTGAENSFFGSFAGQKNTSGGENSFFGNQTGGNNTTGAQNSFFGKFAGANNTTGNYNSLFGFSAGLLSTTANLNSFFGYGAGYKNTTGSGNSFFGWDVAFNNTNGGSNSFFGHTAGFNNTTGSANSFFGLQAGLNNTIGVSNTALGFSTDVGTNLLNATAIGANARVTANNSLVLGSINGVNTATSDTNVGIGTTAPQARLDVRGNTALVGSVGVGTTAPIGTFNVVGSEGAGRGVQIDNREIKLRGDGDGHFSFFANRLARTLTIEDTSASFNVNTPGNVLVTIARDGGNVGIGTTTPLAKLHVNGVIRMDSLGSPVGIFPLCWNANDQIASCSSSSLRYKATVKTFIGGLEIVNRLRPISFIWRESGMRDLGLAAEEVEKVEPLLTYRNKQGDVEGVRYNQLSAVFINAFKEQQAQIEKQQQQINQLIKEVRQLRASHRRNRR
jgi:hypothetical protein